MVFVVMVVGCVKGTAQPAKCQAPALVKGMAIPVAATRSATAVVYDPEPTKVAVVDVMPLESRLVTTA